MKKNIALFTAFFLMSITLFAQEAANKMDSNGQRDGLWKGNYSESKRPRYEGTFNHGKETGIFKFYDDTKASKLMATRDFTAKDGSCYTIFYDTKGYKVSEGREVNKMNEGEWKIYHKESAVIMASEMYSKGKLTGVRKVYYPNKALSEETGYVNGTKEGIYKKYTDKGIVLEDAMYKNDVFHGPATYKNTSGGLVAIGQFTNGKKSGIWKYYENNKVVRQEDKSAVRKSAPKAKKM